jgi:AcrR family transcriptional regulator
VRLQQRAHTGVVGVLGVVVSERPAEQRRLAGPCSLIGVGVGAAEPVVGEKPAHVLVAGDQPRRVADARAFARSGFAGTGLDEVAEEAGITRVLLYRHFESKQDMYRAVLDRACTRLVERVGADDYDETSIPELLAAAGADPDGFRLLFRHAVREPEFRDLTDTFTAASTDVAHRHLCG